LIAGAYFVYPTILARECFACNPFDESTLREQDNNSKTLSGFYSAKNCAMLFSVAEKSLSCS